MSVALFGDTLLEAAKSLRKGELAYLEGLVRLRIWEGPDGQQRAGLSLTASKIEPLGRIGKRRNPAPPVRETGRPVSSRADTQARSDWQAPPRHARPDADPDIPF